MVRRKIASGFIPATMMVAFFIFRTVCWGGEAGGTVYTLDQSIQYALEHNWTVKERAEKVAGSSFGEREANADFYPVLSTDYSYTRTGDVPSVTIPDFGSIQTGDEDTFQWSASVTQPLFTGYALTSTHELAALGIDAAEAALALEKLELALQVKAAYFKVLAADKAVAVAQSAVAALESHQAVAEHFHAVGMTPVNDLLMAEVELANARHDLIKARNDAGLARGSFNLLLARPFDSEVTLEDVLAFTAEPVAYETALGRALAARPEITAMDIADAQADRQITLAKSSYYPEAAFVASYIKQGDSPDVSGSRFQDSDNWQAMIELSWTFWDWKKTRYAVSRNESAKQQLLQTRRQLEDNIRFELKKALMDMATAEEKIPTAEKAVSQAEENLRVSEERYKTQSTTSTEVLDAQSLLSQARMNYYRALYDHKLATAALKRAMGEY